MTVARYRSPLRSRGALCHELMLGRYRAASVSDPWPRDWVGPWWVEQHRAGRPPGPSWTSVGSLAGPERLLVDPRGYLCADGCSWGVDWWLGADDRWHVPSREAAVRQALVGDAPVVQTSVRVPSGDVHARVGAIAVGDGTTRVAVEIHNDSAAPVALALALRPSTAAGRGRIAEASLDGSVVRVGATPAVLLPERPRAAWVGGRDDGDPFTAVSQGMATDPTPLMGVECSAGMAGVVVVVPLAHRSTYRWQLALSESVASAVSRRRSRRWRPGPPARPRPVSVASLDAVARGWAAQTSRLVRVELPPTAALAPLGAVRSHLLLATGAGQPDPEVTVAAATGGLGVSDPQFVLESAPVHLRATALWAAARLVGLGGSPPDPRLVKSAVERLGASSRDTLPAARNLLATGIRAAAQLLDASGELEASAAVDRWAHDLAAEGQPPRPVAHALPGAWLPAAPLADSGSLPPPPHGPLSTTSSAAVAAAALGDPTWHAHLAALTAVATPTVTWPDAAGARGDDPVALARWWSAVRAFLVDDSLAGHLALLTAWPPEFGRAPLEAHQLPAAMGLASFAVRWHGDRPALLWDIDGAPSDLIVLAPGLDPEWRGVGPRGEALIDAPPHLR